MLKLFTWGISIEQGTLELQLQSAGAAVDPQIQDTKQLYILRIL